MYICQVTGKQSKPGEKLHKIVVQTRACEYKCWDRESEEEWFSQGWEIVKEINASEEGVAIWNDLTAEEREEFVKGLN